MNPDVIVIGCGNAALCAALAAREGGASVLVLEKAPEHERGGNSFFTAGGFRFAHQGLADLRRDILTDLSDEEAATIEVPATRSPSSGRISSASRKGSPTPTSPST
jgi:tricarballylate dehydrogenase